MQDCNYRGRQSALSVGLYASLVFLVVFAFSGSSGFATEEPGTPVKSKAAIDLSPFVPPTVLDRAGWQAKPALPGMKKQESVAIVLHHTGVRQNPGVALDAKLRGLQSYSQRPGQVSPTRTKPAWPDVPYHFYVDYAGNIAEGRDVQYAGDTNTRYDTKNYIQVAVEGEFEQEMPAPEQMLSLRKILVWLMLAWDIRPEKISIHKDHAPSTCPGRNFIAMLPEQLGLVAADRNKAISEICAKSPSAKFSSTYCTAR